MAEEKGDVTKNANITLRINSSGDQFSEDDLRVVFFKGDGSIQTFDVFSAKVISSIVYLAIKEQKGRKWRGLEEYPIFFQGRTWFKYGGQAQDAFSQRVSGKSVANDKRIARVVYQILVAAGAGGMAEKRIGELYDEIMSCYSKLHPNGADVITANLFNMIFPELNGILD